MQVVLDVLDGGTREAAEVKLAVLDMRNSCCLRNAESLWRGCILHPFYLILLLVIDVLQKTGKRDPST